ncbi:Ig-like domain-containing domain [Cohnella faecalis]|nr:Ig-like domain-containing protein [Cohnella faecalis]
MTRFRAISLFLIVAILLQMGAVTVSPKSAAAASAGPILKSQSPANGSFITPDRGIRITFDENVRKGSGNIIFGSEVYPVATDDVHIQWETTKTILIKPTDLAVGQDYSVILEAGAFIGVTSGLPSAEYDLGTFSVRSLGVLDVFDETVASPYYPENGAVDIDADKSVALKLYFNQSGMKIGTGNVYIKKYTDNTIAQTIKTSTTATKISNATVGEVPVSFTSIPMSKLANSTKYYVMIDPGAFVDEYGNPFPGITNKEEWTFTTEELFDTVAPTASNFVFISSGASIPRAD